MASILAVPGLSKQTPAFLTKLYDLAFRNGWSVDGIAALMSEESGFNPQAKNPLPKQTATGLLQWTQQTARSIGTTVEEIFGMTATEQLDVVEDYYLKYLGKDREISDDDYILIGYGRSDLIGKPDYFVVDSRSSIDPASRNRYDLNSGYDRSGKGYITVGDLRAALRRTIARAGGRRIEVPDVTISPGRPKSRGFALSAIALAVLGLSALAWTKRKG